MGWKIDNCNCVSSEASIITLVCARQAHLARVQLTLTLQCVWGSRHGRFTGRVSSPLTTRAAEPCSRQIIVFFLCKCIRLGLIAASKAAWVDQNTNLSNCLGCCWPLVNFEVNPVKLAAHKSRFGNCRRSKHPAQSRVLHSQACKSNRSSSSHWLLKNKTGESFFVCFSELGRFPHQDSEICMADSDTADTFTAVDDKLHLLIQADSSPTS